MRLRRRLGLVCAVAAAAWPQVAHAADTTPPTLTALSVAPAAVDTSSAPAVVTFTATIVDDASGVPAGYSAIGLRSPSGKQTTSGTFFTDLGGGRFAARVAIAAHSETGVWTVAWLSIQDGAKNQRWVYPSDLALLGTDPSVTVTGVPDTTPPAVSALAVSPGTLDTGLTPAVATVTATITDDLAGVSDTTDPCVVSCYGASLVYFVNPSLSHAYGFPFTNVGGDRYVAKVELPAGSAVGVWRLDSLQLVDLAGNERYLRPLELPADLRISLNVVAAGTAPTISHAVSGELGANGWYTTAPTVTFSCADPTYGVASCTGPTTLGESAAAQTVSGTVVGNAGSIATDSVTVRADLSDPVVTCRGASAFMLNQAGAEVAADVTDAVSGPEAAVVSTGVSTATAGVFSAKLTGRDAAGRTTTVSCRYTVLATVGLASLTTFQNQTTIALAWTAPNADAWVASYDVRYQSARLTGGFGAWTMLFGATTATAATYSGEPGSTYCFAVRARDAEGDVTPWSAYKCTALPVDDASLAAAGSWTGLAGDGYYLGTALTSSTAGDSLTLADVQAKRVGVLATKCRGCGTIQLFWNGVLVAQASLNAPSTTRANLVATAAFDTLQTGTLTVKVASAGAPVEIDALAVTQRFS